jgi:hypothetical protein
MNSRGSAIGAAALFVVLQHIASAQVQQPSGVTELCKVTASPDGYDGKMLTLEGILLPGDHSVLLYSPSCKPREGLDVGIQAIFPEGWASSPKGKKLHKMLKRGFSAKVTVTGTVQSGPGRFGPDVARFRFTIKEISSVKKAPQALG